MIERPLQIPGFTRALGLGGLVPMVVFSAALWLPLSAEQHVVAQTVLYCYAALILSFLGAIHWGLALAKSRPGEDPDAVALLWGVSPCLLGWIALMLAPPAGGALLVAGFVAQWLMDWRRLDVLGAPPWFLRLRTLLSVLVVLSLGAALAALLSHHQGTLP